MITRGPIVGVNLLGLAAFGLGACAHRATSLPPALVASTDHTGMATAVPQAHPPLATPGEQMRFRMSLHGLELAELSIDVGDYTTLDGVDTVVVQSQIRTTKVAAWLKPVTDDFTSWIDRKTGRSVRFFSREDEHELDTTDVEYTATKMTVHDMDPGEESNENQVVRGPIGYDFNSFVVFLRGWEAEPGARVETDIMRSMFMWRNVMVVGGYENLETVAMGQVAVVRYDGEGVRILRDGTLDPTSDRRRWTVWISDDADRVPVKVTAHTDFGDVNMDLVSYRPAPGAR